MVTIRKILPKSAYRCPIMRKKRAMWKSLTGFVDRGGCMIHINFYFLLRSLAEIRRRRDGTLGVGKGGLIWSLGNVISYSSHFLQSWCHVTHSFNLCWVVKLSLSILSVGFSISLVLWSFWLFWLSWDGFFPFSFFPFYATKIVILWYLD